MMSSKNKDMVGKLFSSNNYGDFKIIYYKNYDNVIVEFIDTGYVTATDMYNIKKGNLRDWLRPTMCGVGVVGYKYKSSSNGKSLPHYNCWSSMLSRCYDEKFKTKHPTYKDCICSDNFKQYTYFYEWCEQQKGFNTFDENGNIFELDKDLLFKENKLYSEYTCVFLPKEVNALVTWYKDYKNENDMYIKEYTLLTLAEKWKDKIDERAYQALKNFLYT